jgi:hypothetical protein
LPRRYRERAFADWIDLLQSTLSVMAEAMARRPAGRLPSPIFVPRSADSLKIAFRVHIVWRVLPDKVKEFIERYSTLRPDDGPDRVVEAVSAMPDGPL